MTKASSGVSAPVASTADASPRKRRRTAKGSPTAPPEPGQARIIAIANQKGGVGKSTTAVSLGAALADLGYRVLVVDLDPQGNASTGLGIRHEARSSTVYDVIVGEAPLEGAVIHTQVERLHAIPSTIDLAGAEIELVSQFSREMRLKKALEPVREGKYDFVLLDCPPSLGLLTVNALAAAEELLVPIQCEYYALEGLGQLLRNVNLVQQNINPSLRLSGIVMTMFDPRTKLSEQVVAEVQRFFGDLVYDVIIPRTVRLSEAPGFGQPITVYDPRSKGAETYRQLAREVATRSPPEAPMPSYEDLPNVAPLVDETREDRPSSVADDGAPPVGGETLPTVHEIVSAPGVEHVEASEVATPAPEVEAPPVTDTEPVEDGSEPAPTPHMATPRDAAPRESPTHLATDDRPDEELWEDPGPPEPRVRLAEASGPPGELPERRVVVIDENADLDIEAAREPLVRAPVQATSPEHEREGMAPIGATLEDEDGGRKRRWRLFRKGGDA